MPAKNILFLGFGDIARRTCALMPEHRRVGVSRTVKPVPDGVTLWQGAADSAAVLGKLEQEAFDAVVITLTPTEYSDAAYKVAYVDTVKALAQHWRQAPAPELLVFVSSTSVYGQEQGQWIDELSPAQPSDFAGARLLEAEQCLRDSGLPLCVIRFAGIYGPGREFLLRQVRAGNGGSDAYSNRIHVQDCAGIIAFLLHQHWRGEPVDDLYLGCDSEPARGTEVRRWLAAQLGLDPQLLKPSASARGGNKRCSNRRLLAAGYPLQYPSYRDGYGELGVDGGA